MKWSSLTAKIGKQRKTKFGTFYTCVLGQYK